jgi:hypothetical protein
MSGNCDDREYKVWAADDVVYGPVSFATAVDWINELRILPGMWLYPMDTGKWSKASELPELSGHFAGVVPASEQPKPPEHSPLIPDVPVGALRKVKLLKTMDDQQLGRFAQFMEVAKVAKFDVVVEEDGPGDAMYLVLAGSLRVRQIIGKKETVITTLNPGEFFGEISLFDDGLRSADVVANEDSVLLKITEETFDALTQKMPEVASPFLMALGRNMARHIRADNARHKRNLLVLQAAKNR